MHIQTHTLKFFLCGALVCLLAICFTPAALAQDGRPAPHGLFLPVLVRNSQVTGTPPAQTTPVPTPTPATPTPPPPTATPDPVARRSWSVFGLQASGQPDSLPALAAAGATWLRPTLTIKWSQVEPVEGARNWGALEDLEAELRAASEKGFWPILTVEGTPDWASQSTESGAGCGPVDEASLPALAAFLTDLSTRLSQDPYGVHHWLLWDGVDRTHQGAAGQDVPGCWGDPSVSDYGGAAYARMLQAASPALKAGDPQAVVILGGLLLDCRDCASASFLEGVLLGGGGGFFDALGFYAFDELTAFDFPWGATFQHANPAWQVDWLHGGPSLLAKETFLRAVLEDFGLSGKLLIGLGSGLACDTCPAGDPDYRQARADYLAQLYAASTGLEAVVWHAFTDLAGPDGVPQAPEDLPFFAYQFARLEGPGSAQAYLGLVQPGDVGGDVEVRGYKYARQGAEVWVLWLVSTEVSARQVTFAETPAAAYNVYGDPLNILPDVAIGTSPVTLVFTR